MGILEFFSMAWPYISSALILIALVAVPTVCYHIFDRRRKHTPANQKKYAYRMQMFWNGRR